MSKAPSKVEGALLGGAVALSQDAALRPKVGNLSATIKTIALEVSCGGPEGRINYCLARCC